MASPAHNGAMSSHEHRNEFGQVVGKPLPQWQAPPFPSHEVMTGRFCRLEPLSVETHANALFAANPPAGSASMWTYLPYGPFPTLENYRQWLGTMAAGRDPQFYAVIDLADGAPIGVTSYLRIDPANGVIEVGHLAYSPRLQRSALATEAMFLMMQRAFALGYRRYEWKCNAHNAPSRAAAVRLGFSYEGLFRQAAVVKGHNRDTAWYAIIDEEWPALSRAFQTWLAPENFDPEGRQRRRLSVLTSHGLPLAE